MHTKFAAGEELRLRKNINAGWEIRDGRSICRWMLVWTEAAQGEIAGCAAGYSGGGTFQLEKFYLLHVGNDVTFLQIDNEEKIQSKFSEFIASVPGYAVEICEDCQDEILSWHDNENWEEAESLYLLHDKSEGLYQLDDMLLFRNADANPLVRVLECLGITSKPIK
jgi:hypothetical protein